MSRAYAALTAVLLGFAAYLIWVGFTEHGYAGAYGDDLAVLTDATVRLFSDGSWYEPWQLAGPYPKGQVDVLYPPVVAWFFAPFVILGPAVYLALGVAVIGWLVWSWRPAPWAWPLIALCLVVPTTVLKPWSGNPSLWIAVAVGAGLRWGWPGALVLLKPTFLPFALAGIRTRGWWLTVGALAVLSLPFLAETLLYPSVLLNAKGETPLYSVWDWPLALIPVIAWSAKHHEVEVPVQIGRVIAAPDHGVRALRPRAPEDREDVLSG